MVIEFHDTDVENVSEGTLSGRAGKEGTILYAYQAEMWVQDVFPDHKSVIRAYGISYGLVVVVWGRGPDGEIYYIAKSSAFHGEWLLPFLHGVATELRIRTTNLGAAGISFSDAAEWAAEQLQQPEVACAILMDDEGVLVSWERGVEGPVMVSRSPRLLSVAV